MAVSSASTAVRGNEFGRSCIVASHQWVGSGGRIQPPAKPIHRCKERSGDQEIAPITGRTRSLQRVGKPVEFGARAQPCVVATRLLRAEMRRSSRASLLVVFDIASFSPKSGRPLFGMMLS